MSNLGYTINLERLCKNQSFQPAQVVSSELVFPKGAVPNSQLIWLRCELTGGKRFFLTLPLSQFHEYVELPESSIGGWTDGDLGSDSAGLNTRYADDDQGGGEEASGSVLDRTESLEGIVET